MHRLDCTCGGASPATSGERGTCLSQLASAPGLRLLWLAWSDEPTVLGPPYLYPFVGSASEAGFSGPSWYWNPWQWPLDSWPNFLVTVIGEAGWLYIAVRLDRTFFEFVWPRMDKAVCRTLRKLFKGHAVEEWSPPERRIVRHSYLAISVAAFFACVLAAARAGSGAATH